MTEGQLGLIVSASAVFGGAAYKLGRDLIRHFRGRYIPKDQLRTQRLEDWRVETERDLSDLRSIIVTHLKLCEETPNKLILAEIENLTNVLHSQKVSSDRIEQDIKDKIMHLRDEIKSQWNIVEEFRKEQTIVMQQILKIIAEK